MTITEQLREAGLTVADGSRPYGRTTDVDGIDVVLTKTGADDQGTVDLNDIVIPARGAFYIERSGRVWRLADGPVGDDRSAKVFVAAHREDTVTEEQAAALETLLSTLDGIYGAKTTKAKRKPRKPDRTS